MTADKDDGETESGEMSRALITDYITRKREGERMWHIQLSVHVEQKSLRPDHCWTLSSHFVIIQQFAAFFFFMLTTVCDSFTYFQHLWCNRKYFSDLKLIIGQISVLRLDTGGNPVTLHFPDKVLSTFLMLFWMLAGFYLWNCVLFSST